MDFLTNNLALIGGGSATAIAMIILKLIPNDKICAFVEGSFEKLGILMTAGLTKFWVTKTLWNKTIEPYCIDAIDNIIVTGISKFVDGLRSDN